MGFMYIVYSFVESVTIFWACGIGQTHTRSRAAACAVAAAAAAAADDDLRLYFGEAELQQSFVRSFD